MVTVPASLARTVDAFWNFESIGRRARILPDGCMDFVFNLNTATARLVGSMTRAEIVSPPSGTRYFGVRFLPGAAALLIDAHASELADASVEHAVGLLRERARPTSRAAFSLASQAELALAAGYADEPHLLRDFRELAAISPSQLALEQRVGFVQDATGAGGHAPSPTSTRSTPLAARSQPPRSWSSSGRPSTAPPRAGWSSRAGPFWASPSTAERRRRSLNSQNKVPLCPISGKNLDHRAPFRQIAGHAAGPGG